MELNKKQLNYQKNRVKIIVDIQARHRINLDNPIYAKLRQAYQKINNCQDKIERHQKTLKQVYKSLSYWTEKKDVLRVEWKQFKRNANNQERTIDRKTA